MATTVVQKALGQKDRKMIGIKLQWQPLSTWPLLPYQVSLVLQPTAFNRIPQAPYTRFLHFAWSLRLSLIPSISWASPRNQAPTATSLHGTLGAIGKETEYVQKADNSDTS